jgi:hypothetical protein
MVKSAQLRKFAPLFVKLDDRNLWANFIDFQRDYSQYIVDFFCKIWLLSSLFKYYLTTILTYVIFISWYIKNEQTLLQYSSIKLPTANRNYKTHFLSFFLQSIQ